MLKSCLKIIFAMPAQSLPTKTPIRKLIPGGHTDWRQLAIGFVIAAGAIAVYSRAFSDPFLFDDGPSVAGNLTIRHLGTAFRPPGDTSVSGRPVLNLSLAINYAISGTAVWSYHALNLAIHVFAGLTLFGIVRRTLALRAGSEASLVAFSAALLWTLHPLQTESVTYIVQRAESLMGLFYLLTLYCFIRGVGPEGRARRLWLVLSAAACLLGMATKEVMVSAPLIVLLYDRTFVAGSFREAWRRRWKFHMALAATWLLLIGLVASTGWDRGGTSGFDVGITPWAYWLTQFEAVTRYLWLSVWPHPLVFEYGTFWVSGPMEVAPCALLVVTLAAAAAVALWRWPAAGFLGAWFFAILAPTSIMPGRIQMIVEHRMYLPLAAVMTLVALGIHAAISRRNWVLSAALAVGLGMLAVQRNEDYHSALSIWSDTVAKRPDNARAHNNLGVVWDELPGRMNDAIAEYNEALRLKPDYPEAHHNLGYSLAKMPARQEDAIVQFEEALRLKPDFADAHNHLGNVLVKMPGRQEDAIAQFEEALRLNPDLAEAHNNLGNAWAEMPGRMNDAIAQYDEALRLKPDFAEAHDNLGNILAKMPGRSEDAIAQFEEALRLKPDFAEAHNNLGYTLGRIPGRLEDAIAQFEMALRLNPDFAEAHNNLGVALTQTPGRLTEANAQFGKAVRLKPDFAPAWLNLGTSWYQLGNLREAAAAFREELRLHPGDPSAQQALAAALRGMDVQE